MLDVARFQVLMMQVEPSTIVNRNEGFGVGSNENKISLGERHRASQKDKDGKS